MYTNVVNLVNLVVGKPESKKPNKIGKPKLQLKSEERNKLCWCTPSKLDRYEFKLEFKLSKPDMQIKFKL